MLTLFSLMLSSTLNSLSTLTHPYFFFFFHSCIYPPPYLNSARRLTSSPLPPSPNTHISSNSSLSMFIFSLFPTIQNSLPVTSTSTAHQYYVYTKPPSLCTHGWACVYRIGRCVHTRMDRDRQTGEEDPTQDAL